MRNVVYIGLGSNQGERVMLLKKSIELLDKDASIEITNFSSIYETAPVGYIDQESFLNMVLEISTIYTPYQTLDILQSIENKLGRKRVIRWGPRTIDLDILLYNQENIVSERLIVPHPRMKERGFVLIPLSEINPNLNLPGDQSLTTLIQQLPDIEGVRVWKQRNGEDAYALFGS